MMPFHPSAVPLLCAVATIGLAMAPPAGAAPPAAQAPIVAQPALAQPAVAQPAIAQPAIAQPAIAQPAVAQPAPGATTTPFQTPDTSSCPYRVSPPAPVDHSEAPPPGQPQPAPVPVRAKAVGGDRMAECGLVLPGGAPPLPAGLTPHAWLVADLDSGAVLAARDPHGRHRAASTIKILTSLLAIRELDPGAEVVGTDLDAQQEGSRVGIGPGGHYTVDQLLHGLLMRSGNDAAHALAVQLGGVPATVRRMDELAARLGALDTRVATPSGLDGAGASVSAYDLGLIFRVAMREPAFAAIIGRRLADFPGFQDKPGFTLSNDNKLLTNYPGALGGKTGFTDDARHTYAGAAQRGGRRLLVVLLRGEQEPVRMWEQAARLLDYGFALPAGGRPVGMLVDAAPPDAGTTTGVDAGPGGAAGSPTAAAAPAAAAPSPDGGATRRQVIYAAAPLTLAALLLAGLWWRRLRHLRRHPRRYP